MDTGAIPDFDTWKPSQSAPRTVEIPDFESWTPTANPPAPASKPGILPSLWNTAQGPRDILKSLAQFTRHPLDTLAGMVQQDVDLAKGAGAAFGRGDILGGIRRGANTLINAVMPGLGASSEDAGQAWEKPGNWREATGKTLGVGVNATEAALASKVVPALARGAAETITPGVKGPVGRLFQNDPRVMINRALLPPTADVDFPEMSPRALAAIKASEGGKAPSGMTNGQLDLIPAANRAIATHQSALDKYLTRAGGRTISGQPVVEATEGAVGRMLPSEQPAGRGLVSRAAQDYGDFTPEQLRTRLALLNERLSPFYKGSPATQSSALADIPEAVLKAQRDAVADTLYRSIDPEGGGLNPRAIQARTGELIDLRNAAQLANKRAVSTSPANVFEKSPVQAHPFMFGHRGGLSGGLSIHLGKPGVTGLIGKAFRGLPDEPYPTLPAPESPLYPTGNSARLLGPGDFQMPPGPDASRVASIPAMTSPLNPRRALPSPDIITPPPADTSYVRSAGLAPHQTVEAMRPALPMATAPFMQEGRGGVVIPDILGGQRTPYNAGLLPAPEPGQPPLNVLPRGPASVQGPPYMPSSAGRPRPLRQVNP